MYPITPAKLNTATITMANMAAPPGGSFYLYLTRRRRSGRYHSYPITDYFFPGASSSSCPQANMATDNRRKLRIRALALVVFGWEVPRISLYARADLAAIRRPGQAALQYHWIAATAQNDGSGRTRADRSPTLLDGATQNPGRANLPSSCP
jgi:hypothetical protein